MWAKDSNQIPITAEMIAVVPRISVQWLGTSKTVTLRTFQLWKSTWSKPATHMQQPPRSCAPPWPCWEWPSRLPWSSRYSPWSPPSGLCSDHWSRFWKTTIPEPPGSLLPTLLSPNPERKCSKRRSLKDSSNVIYLPEKVASSPKQTPQ